MVGTAHPTGNDRAGPARATGRVPCLLTTEPHMTRQSIGWTTRCAVIAVTLTFATIAAEDSSPRTTFLAHFNAGTRPDVGQLAGEVQLSNCGITSGRMGYPFSDSQPFAEALDMRNMASRIEFPIAEGFVKEQGTIELWYRHTRRDNLVKPFIVLLRVMFEGTTRPETRLGDSGDQFVVVKLENTPTLVLSSRSAKRGVPYKTQPAASVETWKKGEWHFIAVTWSGTRGAIYLDGRLAGEGVIVPSLSKPKSLVLGSSFWGHDAEGIYDELRILSDAISAEQVMRDYERGALQRLEFPTSGKPTDARSLFIAPYEPVAPTAVASTRMKLLDASFTAVLAADPPQLDGKLGDGAWRLAPEVSSFVRRGRKPKPAEADTHVRFLYDTASLYVGIRLDEPNMDRLRQEVVNQHDMPVWSDDCFELVFDTSGCADSFFHFAVNAAGTIADLRAGRLSWSAQNARAKISKGKDHWTIELAIPFEDLGVTPRYGEIWGARICRERYAVEKGASAEQSSVPYTRTGFNVYANLGQLRFGAAEEQNQPVQVMADGRQSAFLGLNELRYTIMNRSKEAAEVELEARAVGVNNVLLALKRVAKRVDGGGKASVAMHVPVKTDDLVSISVTAYDRQAKKHVFGVRLPSAVTPVQPTLAEVRRMLPRLSASTTFLPKGHALSEVVRESIARISSKLKVFEGQLATAMAERRQLSEQEWDAFRRELAGFGAWLGRNRLVAWPDDPWANGLPSDFPLGNEKLERLSMEMAGNERQAVSLSLTGLAVPGTLDIQVVALDLKGKENPRTRISKNSIHVYWAAPFRDELRKLVADPLIKADGNIFSIGTGRTLKLWVVVSSSGVAPGTYEGDLVVRPLDTLAVGADEWLRVPLRVTVWPFQLPETKDNPLQAFMWGGSAYHRSYIDPVEMTRDLYEHRVNWVMCDWYQIANGSSRKRFSVFTDEDLERVRMVLEQAKARGMKVMFAWNSPAPEAIEGVVEYLHRLGFGDHEFASMSAKDEFGSKHVPRLLEYHQKVERLGSKMRFMCTYCSAPPYGATLDEVEPLTKHIDIWLNHRGKWWPPSDKARRLIEFQKQRGLTVGSYQCGSPMRIQPMVDYFRLYPWKAWKMGVEFVAYWTYLGVTSGDSDFWDVHHVKKKGGHGPSGMVYNSPGGRLNPSKRYEAFREGMEDYCYLWILKRRIEAAKKRGQNVVKAEEALAACVEAGLAARNMGEVDAVRRRLAEAIMELSPVELPGAP